MNDAIVKFMEKVESYQLFNYFLPGVITINVLENITSLSFPNNSILLRLFIYYFSGMVISRLGSIWLEFFYKGLGWVIYSNYGDYLKVEEHDNKIEILSSENNTYRTILASLFIMLIIYVLDQFEWFIDFNNSKWNVPIYLFLLILLFSKSYRKQTTFVRKRVHAKLNINDKEKIAELKKSQRECFLKTFKKNK